MTQPTMGGPAPKSNTKKILLIIAAIVVFFMLGCCGVFTMCMYTANKAVQRTVHQDFESLRINTTPPEAAHEEPVVALPDNFPKDVPVYSGLKARTAVADRVSGGGYVVFEGKKGDAAAVTKFYSDKLRDEGWKEVTNATVGAQTMLEHTKDGRKVSVLIIDTNDAISVQIGYQKKP